MFTADGAENEQLAGRTLKRRRMGDNELDALAFPNQKLVLKDKGHAARRLTKRGWGRDDVLADVMSSIVTSRDSPVQMIRRREGISAQVQQGLRSSW